MTVLLELALAMELIVTSYFWAVLWHEVSGAAKFQHNPLRKAGLAMDHSVPIFLLLIEYIFMDAAPVTLRHLWVFMLVSLAYLITNLTVTLTSQPVYPDVTWKGAKGIGLPLGILVAAVLAYLFLYQVTKAKLRCLGHGSFHQRVTASRQAPALPTAQSIKVEEGEAL